MTVKTSLYGARARGEALIDELKQETEEAVRARIAEAEAKDAAMQRQFYHWASQPGGLECLAHLRRNTVLLPAHRCKATAHIEGPVDDATFMVFRAGQNAAILGILDLIERGRRQNETG